MATKVKISKTARLLKFLQAGNNITAGQAVRRFGIKSLSSTATRLRNQGYAVYCNDRKINGETKKAYRIGNPTKAVVAAGYRAIRVDKRFERELNNAQRSYY